MGNEPAQGTQQHLYDNAQDHTPDQTHDGAQNQLHERAPQHGHTHSKHLQSHDKNDEEPSLAPHLLKYLLEHNNHHVAELHELMHQLEDTGFLESAEAVSRALEHYKQGNSELASAVEKLEG